MTKKKMTEDKVRKIIREEIVSVLRERLDPKEIQALAGNLESDGLLQDRIRSVYDAIDAAFTHAASKAAYDSEKPAFAAAAVAIVRNTLSEELPGLASEFVSKNKSKFTSWSTERRAGEDRRSAEPSEEGPPSDERRLVNRREEERD